MCKKMTFLICIVSVLALANSAQAVGVTEIKCDISCPGNAGMKAGGDWTDLEWGNGCDGEQHDARSWSVDGVAIFAGNPGGHCNIWHDGGGDPLTNNKYGNPSYNEDTLMVFRISNLDAGDYTVVVVGEGGASGTYNFTSTGPGDVWTVIDATGPGLDNFILTGGAAPELGACCLPDGRCIDEPMDFCEIEMQGIWQGPGTDCATTQCVQLQACCMLDGSCQDLTEEECAAQGGAAQGEGTDCATTECQQPGACCLPDGRCIDETMDFCEIEMQGKWQGEGTACSETTIACCVADGECVDADPLCCDDLDGAPGYADMCLGDLDGNNIDDACEEPCACLGDLDTNDQVDLQDLDAMVNLLVAAGPPFIVDCPDVRCYCADFDDSSQVDLQDLDAMVNLLVSAGPPFIVDCTPD